MECSLGNLARKTDGAAAPTVALLIFVLVAMAGIGFDYSRLASLDTELQNAADQAALAAASQLDQEAGTIDRATAAAEDLVNNLTLFGNDGSSDGTEVELAEVVFYADKDDATAENGTLCPTTGAVTTDAEARFVCVRTVTRTANFALTPVVGALSGDASAMAVAGLGSAICKTPPVMICNPDEDLTATPQQLDFDANAYIGHGLRLVTVGGGPGYWAPGNFGYLDSGGGSNGAPGLREALGWDTPPGQCLAQTGVDTKPGATVTVTDALNTRFDVYQGDVPCPTGGKCPASINSMKDVRRSANASGNNACKLHNNGWGLPTNPYLPISDGYLPSTLTPDAMGHPRDICHYRYELNGSGGCSDPIGDGNWDRDAYFRTNYGVDHSTWTSRLATDLSITTTEAESVTRYQVYKWEIAELQAGRSLGTRAVLGPTPTGATGATKVNYGAPVCSPTKGYGNGTIPDEDTADRRKISVAVINCAQNSVNGAEDNLPVIKWVDVFLVEPSFNRGRPSTYLDGSSVPSGSNYTTEGDVYAEIIGDTETAGGGAPLQVVRRDVPYLLK